MKIEPKSIWLKMATKVPFLSTEYGYPFDYLRYTPEFFLQICQETGFELFESDVQSTSGLYYTAHELSKLAIVAPDLPKDGSELMLKLHMLYMLLLTILSPFDSFLIGLAPNLI